MHPEWARQGIASNILQQSEAAAQAAGFRQTWLLATLTAEPFYRRHGYAEIGRREVYQPDGVGLECVEMVKSL